jgi:hypothetical protein
LAQKSEALGVDGKIILKWFVKKCAVILDCIHLDQEREYGVLAFDILVN